jgi:hypothetical protein
MKSIILAVLMMWVCVSNGQDNGQSMHSAGQQERLRLNSPNTDSYIGESTIGESTSPFFSDKWMKSTLVFANGKTQSGLSVKLDLFENKIYFLDDAGNEMVSTTPVKEVVLADTAGNKMYRLKHSSAFKIAGVEAGWYQLLCVGQAELYKKIIKALPRSMAQQSEQDIKPLETSIQFFLLIKDNLFRIKKGKDIPELAGEKKTQLQTYAKSKNLNGKLEENLIELVEYYNTLK